MKFNFYTIHSFLLILISFLKVNHFLCEAKILSTTKNQDSINFLAQYDQLNFQESCVICKFALQKVDKERDVTRECAEIAESEYIKEKQKEWVPDNSFLSKWKMLYDIQKKLMEEKGRPFKHDDDHYYYIIHPDHIKNYIVIKNDTECDNSTGNCSKNQTKSKTFTINITQEQNETIIIPPTPCGDRCKNRTDNRNGQNNDQEGVIERKTITFHDFDNTLPFPNDLLITHEFQNVSNQTKSLINAEKSHYEQDPTIGFSQIKDINGDNDKILNKFFNPRFKTIDKKAENLTCNSSKKTHQEINIHSETNIPLWNNRDNFNNQFGSNTFRSRKKQYVIKEGPYQVDQDKLDKVFKKNGREDFRYNQSPSNEHTVSSNPLNYYLPGNFVIDKNINKGNFAPTSFLIPEPHYNYFDIRALQKNNYPRFSEKRNFKQNPQTNYKQTENDYNNFNSLQYTQQKEAKPARPGDNIYQILKGGKYTGFGKALLPPHPEDFYPESDCCYTFPCVSKPPCRNLLQARNQKPQEQKPNTEYSDFNFLEKEQKDEESDQADFLFIPPSQIFSNDYLSGNKNVMFLEIDQNSTQLPKRKRHCLSNRNQSNNSNSTSPNPETNKTIDGVNPQNKCKKIVKSKNKIKSKNKNKTETNKQTKTKKNSNNKTKNTKIKNKITDIEKIRSSAFTFDKETNRRARRRGDLPDPEWDCLERNIKDLIHFICEQEVSLGYTKYCKPLLAQMNLIVEGFLYHDSIYEICQNIRMCPFQ